MRILGAARRYSNVWARRDGRVPLPWGDAAIGDPLYLAMRRAMAAEGACIKGQAGRDGAQREVRMATWLMAGLVEGRE